MTACEKKTMSIFMYIHMPDISNNDEAKKVTILVLDTARTLKLDNARKFM